MTLWCGLLPSRWPLQVEELDDQWTEEVKEWTTWWSCSSSVVQCGQGRRACQSLGRERVSEEERRQEGEGCRRERENEQ